MISRMRTWLLTLPLLLGGCASYLDAQVTSFHPPDQRFGGRRFAIEAPPEQKDSLEFQSYSELVRRALVGRGLVDGGTGGPVELAVTVRYAIDDGKAVVYSTPNYGYMNAGPVWGLTPYYGPGGVVRYAWTPSYPMTYGMVGQSYGQSVLYRRELRVEINDRRPGATPPRLFEGTAVSEGRSASLAPVMPAMIRALFEDFPGPNGGTRVVRVQMEPERAVP